MTAARKRPWWEHPYGWLFAAGAYSLVILSRWLVVPPGGIPVIWPTTALLAVALMTLPREQRARCALAALAAGLPLGLSQGYYIRPVIGCAEGVLLAALTVRACGRRANFADLRTLLVFLGFAVVPAAILSAAVLYLLSFLEPFTLRQAASWVVSHMLGSAIFAPAFSILIHQRRYPRLNGTPLEFAASLLVLAGVAAAFVLTPGKTYAFLVFPLAMLIAFRHGPVGSAMASLVLAALALVATHTPVAALGPQDANLVEWVQGFVVVVFLTTLPAAGAVASYARTRSLLAARSATARAARHKADAAAAAKGEFLANMSHEIRTPLNGVIGLADALSRTDLTAQQREMLAMVTASGKALTGLLSDALDLARADSGALRLVEEPFDVRQSIREAAYLFEATAREKGLGFEVAFDLHAPAAVGDALRIKQIVSNLISNAVKFTAAGAVTVGVRFDASGLTVAVRDTGPGFDAETRARLFNRFEQGDSSVTRRYGGSGLGLAIANRLATMMGGSMGADATPGQGAVFTFTAPLKPAARTGAAAAKAEMVQAALDDEAVLRVLLAEDNLVNQKVVQAMIGELCDLVVVGNGAAAVEAFRSQAFDVVLMDTHMPVMDGLEAIRAIREHETSSGRRTPLVSLTADAMPQQVAAAREAGADLHVAKPITAEALIRALQTCAQMAAEQASGQDTGQTGAAA